jgi:hypothetical protein
MSRQEFDQYVSRKDAAEAVLTQAQAARPPTRPGDGGSTSIPPSAIDAAVARVQRIRQISTTVHSRLRSAGVIYRLAEPARSWARAGRSSRSSTSPTST